MPEQTQDLKAIADYYYDLVSRNRWLVIIPFCIAMAAGICLSVVWPKMYQSSTVILVRPQKVSENYVRAIVDSDLQSRIATISEQILSRSNIKKIIRDFNLFPGAKEDGAVEEEQVDLVRSQIDVSVSRRRKGSDAFTISYKSRNPEEAMKVANGLALRFMEENLKEREAQAIGTSDFLGDEQATTGDRLQTLEKSLQDYRSKHMGELPGQLNSNLRILDGLQRQLDSREESLLGARNRLAMLESQIQTQTEAEAAGLDKDGSPMTLAKLKQQLVDLETKYTERHPDVIRVRNMIEQIQQRMGAGQMDQASDQDQTAQDRTARVSGALRKLYEQRKMIEWEIEKIQRQMGELNASIEEYKRRVEETPKREQELLSLTRDYENMKNSYESLLRRKLEADIAVNLEKKQKAEQFQIIDPANLPSIPISPNLRKLILLAIAGGLGLGGGLVVLRDMMDTSVRKPEDLEEHLGIPLVAIIPKLYQSRDIARRRINFCFTVVGVVFALLLVSVFGLMVFNGVDETMKLVGIIAGNYHS
jgi:polysaccharide chain length determinant protein (PEP-CTERM system associated)